MRDGRGSQLDIERWCSFMCRYYNYHHGSYLSTSSQQLQGSLATSLHEDDIISSTDSLVHVWVAEVGGARETKSGG